MSKGSINDNPKSFVTIQKNSLAQMNKRRRKGLCNSKRSRGHFCAIPKLFLIEEIEWEKATNVNHNNKEKEDPGNVFLKEALEISLNAIIVTPSLKTIRIVGILRNQNVIILIDLGSTHNFVDARLAEILVKKCYASSKNLFITIYVELILWRNKQFNHQNM